jgi:hypothetical protein
MSTTQQPTQPQITAGSRKGVQFQPLIDGIEALTQQVMERIDAIRKRSGEGDGKEMSIADMFDLQMAMNKLQQFSEMSTSVLSAMNGSINSMARNVKG